MVDIMYNEDRKETIMTDILYWNNHIRQVIEREGTWTGNIGDKTIHIEKADYWVEDEDEPRDGYVAWWSHIQGVQTLGLTPYEAYSDSFDTLWPKNT